MVTRWLVPIFRLIEATVRSGLRIAWRFAAAPTARSPLLVKPTTEGVRWLPSAFGMTLGSPPSITATTELVVPRSIPTVLGIACYLSCFSMGRVWALRDATEHPSAVDHR